MAVYKRGKNYWVAFCINKKRYRRRSPDNSIKGAQAYEALLRQRLARGQPLDDPNPKPKHKFREVVLQWLSVYVKNNNKPSESLIKKYVVNAQLIPFFGSKYIEDIDTYKIEQFKNFLIDKKKLSQKTINNYLSILRRCLRSAMEWGIIREMPNIKLLKVPLQSYDYLTEEETEQLLKHAKGMWYDMILLAVRTGLRFGEIIALQWTDINLREGILTVNKNIVRGIEGSPKNNKSRPVPLTPRVISMIRNANRESKYIFHDSKGAPLRYNDCLDKLHEICKMGRD